MAGIVVTVLWILEEPLNAPGPGSSLIASLTNLVAIGETTFYSGLSGVWGRFVIGPLFGRGGTTAAAAVKGAVRRTAGDLAEQLAMQEAKGGAGRKIIDKLSDPKFKGMEKWQHVHRTPEGKVVVVHYVRNPVTGELMDFKFK